MDQGRLNEPPLFRARISLWRYRLREAAYTCENTPVADMCVSQSFGFIDAFRPS